MTWTQPGDPLCSMEAIVSPGSSSLSWVDAVRWPDPFPHHDLNRFIVPGRAP